MCQTVFIRPPSTTPWDLFRVRCHRSPPRDSLWLCGASRGSVGSAAAPWPPRGHPPLAPSRIARRHAKATWWSVSLTSAGGDGPGRLHRISGAEPADLASSPGTLDRPAHSILCSTACTARRSVILSFSMQSPVPKNRGQSLVYLC